MKLPKIIHYVDDDGKILWTDPMIYKRLWAVGDWLMHDSQTYQVRWVSLSNLGHIQRVEIVPCKSSSFAAE